MFYHENHTNLFNESFQLAVEIYNDECEVIYFIRTEIRTVLSVLLLLS